MSSGVVPPALAKVGDTIVFASGRATVLRVDVFMPGSHPDGCPARPWHVARQVTTILGERWNEHRPGARYMGAEVLGKHPRGVSFEE